MGVGTDMLNTLGPAKVLVAGSFDTDASGDPDTATDAIVRGRGYTVTRPATGQYRIAFDRKYPAIESVVASILKSSASGLAVEVEAIDLTNKRVDLRVNEGDTDRRYQSHQKTAADGAASTATSETAVGMSVDAVTLEKVYFVPAAALTADDTNYATITASKRASGGGSKTTVASVTTQATGGSGNWTAWAPVEITLAAAPAPTIAALSSFTFEISKTGTGVVVPAGVLVLVTKGTGAAANIVSGEVHFVVMARNTSVA